METSNCRLAERTQQQLRGFHHFAVSGASHHHLRRRNGARDGGVHVRFEEFRDDGDGLCVHLHDGGGERGKEALPIYAAVLFIAASESKLRASFPSELRELSAAAANIQNERLK